MQNTKHILSIKTKRSSHSFLLSLLSILVTLTFSSLFFYIFSLTSLLFSFLPFSSFSLLSFIFTSLLFSSLLFSYLSYHLLFSHFSLSFSSLFFSSLLFSFPLFSSFLTSLFPSYHSFPIISVGSHAGDGECEWGGES